MRFQPGRKMSTAPATCSVSMYLSRASTSSNDVSFSLIWAIERFVSAEYSGPQITLQLVCRQGGRYTHSSFVHSCDISSLLFVSATLSSRNIIYIYNSSNIRGKVTHIVLSSLLIFIFLLAVHRWRDKVGHLDTIFQEILCEKYKNKLSWNCG